MEIIRDSRLKALLDNWIEWKDCLLLMAEFALVICGETIRICY